MTHDYHGNLGPLDAILYDGCAECDKRAADPMTALLNLDRANADLLWRRMLANEREIRPDELTAHGYRSQNEWRVGKLLYQFCVFEERNGSRDPEDGRPDVDVWASDRFRP